MDRWQQRWMQEALERPGRTLWWAGAEALNVAPRADRVAYTWRVDVAESLRGQNVACGVTPPEGPWDRLVVRMPKEKALGRAALAAGASVRVGGEVVLVGGKDEGAVSLAKATIKLAGDATIERDGAGRRFTWTRGEHWDLPAEDLAPRPCYSAFGVTVYGGPGVFSWKKVDPGTQRLLAWAEDALAVSGRWLDLGCGAGLIARWLADRGAEVVGTDSNHFAVRAAEATLDGRGVVLAANAGGGLDGGFDGLLCNPPFHAGFDHERALTGRFVRAARRLVREGGRAIFVVNAFVPLEREAQGIFAETEVRFDDGRYRVVEART